MTASLTGEIERVHRESGTRTHLPHLDGLRGLASLFVVVGHLWLAIHGMKALNGLAGLLTNWLLYGHLAVDVFIVLSGFCLALPYAGLGSNARVRTSRFYFKRARRMLPPYFAAITISILLAMLAQIFFSTSHRVHLQTASILVNLLMLQDTFPSLNVFNAPLWTVAIEIKIYLLFPFFMYAYQRRGLTLMLLVAGAIGYGLTALTLAMAPNAELGHSCLWYVALFGMGMAAALGAVGKSTLKSRRWTGLWLLAFGVSSAILLWEFPVTPGGEAAFFVPRLPYIDSAVGAFAACFLYSITREAKGTARISHAIKLLSWRPLVFVGSFAYSLYLIHYPLITYATLSMDRILQLAGMSRHTVEFIIITMPLILASAYLFFLVFERPFLSSTSRAGSPQSLALHTRARLRT
jgi:peptidoglycan/LPS O-acetylase OafA/YrhL